MLIGGIIIVSAHGAGDPTKSTASSAVVTTTTTSTTVITTTTASTAVITISTPVITATTASTVATPEVPATTFTRSVEVLSDSDGDSFAEETNCDVFKEGKLFCMYAHTVHVHAKFHV